MYYPERQGGIGKCERLLGELVFLQPWHETDAWQAKPTHGNIIRFAPPLVITEEELRSALATIGEALKELPTAKRAEAH